MRKGLVINMRKHKEGNKYVLGVDGGGTKTQCALYDVEGNLYAITTFGPTNHEDYEDGLTGLEKQLFKILDQFLFENGVMKEEIVYSVFGMAGVDTKKQNEAISKIIRRYGLHHFQLCNDSYLGIMAGSGSGMGICAINGTGFSVTGMNLNGDMVQCGGLGYLTGDKGGGGYLFERAISSVYAYLYKKGPYTLMYEKIWKSFEIRESPEYIETIMDWMESRQPELIKIIDKIVYEAAKDKDPVAIRILEEIGEEYVINIMGVFDQLKLSSADQIKVILAGSQFTKAESLTSIRKIEEMLEEQLPEAEIMILKSPCVLGAISWALKKAGGKCDLHEKVMKEYENHSICVEEIVV